MEAKLKHLEIIQAAISRMAGNLFFLKGWAVTLVAALFALAAKDANPKYVFVALWPVVIFWVLDGYFLSQERKFRGLYDHVRKLEPSAIDFSMDTSILPHDRRNGWFLSMFSPSLAFFYISLLAIMGATAYLINN